MKTIKTVTIIHNYVKVMPEIEDMDEGVLYVSKEYNTAIHACLCGCRNQVVTPLNANGWKLSTDKGVTMTPSIGSFSLPCKSHYIITKGVANFV